MTRLKQPPLQEAFIRIDYQPSDEGIALDQMSGKFFFDSLPAYKAYDMQFNRSAELLFDDKGNPDVDIKPPQMRRMRGKNEDETYWVILGNGNVSVNFLAKNKPEKYRGFSSLLDETLLAHQQYVKLFKPKGLSKAHLCYIDVFSIPWKEDLDLSNYLNLRLAFPSEMCPIAEFIIGVAQPLDDNSGVIRVNLERLPCDEETSGLNLRMSWHSKVLLAGGSQEPEIKTRLKYLHDRVWTCFRSCFTNIGWELFGGEIPNASDIRA